MKNPIRILICSFTYPPQVNGVAKVVHRHATYFASLGYRVTVVTGKPKSGDPPLEEDGIEVVTFAASGNGHFFSEPRGEINDYRKLISEWDGDICFFHCWGTWTTDLALALLPELRYKTVMVSHGFDYQRYPRNTKFPRGLRSWIGWQPYVLALPRNLKNFDRLVFLSDSCDPRFYYDHKIAAKHAPDSIRVISSGIDVSEFDEHPATAPQAPDNAREVLVVGNYFKNHKHQEMALRAFAAIGDTDQIIRFIGSSLNEYTDYLKNEAVSLGISDRVTFNENLSRSEVVSAYLRCSLVVCSSVWESGPIVLLEAMAAKKPFISTDVGFASTLPGGIVVNSEADMTAAICQLLKDEVESKRLGELGYSAVRDRFDWGIVLESYGLLIEELIAET